MRFGGWHRIDFPCPSAVPWVLCWAHGACTGITLAQGMLCTGELWPQLCLVSPRHRCDEFRALSLVLGDDARVARGLGMAPTPSVLGACSNAAQLNAGSSHFNTSPSVGVGLSPLGDAPGLRGAAGSRHRAQEPLQRPQTEALIFSPPACRCAFCGLRPPEL